MIPYLRISLLILPTLLFGADGSIIQRWNFEGNSPFKNLRIEGEPPVVIPDPLNPKNRVMHAVLRPDAKLNGRSEVRFDRIEVGEERWVGCRIFRPSREQYRRVCLFQIGPIVGAPGRGGRGLYQIISVDSAGVLEWTFRGYMSRVTGTDFSYEAGPVTLGVWDEWVMHVKVRSDAEGRITVWRNGEQIADHPGQNAFKGDRVAVKWGPYIGSNSVTNEEIHVYYDDVVIGDENARYEDVSPGRKSPRPSP